MFEFKRTIKLMLAVLCSVMFMVPLTWRVGAGDEGLTVVKPLSYALFDEDVEAVISEALSHVSDEMSDIEKVLVLHDWLSAHCDYDALNYYEETIPWDSFTAQGAFLNGKAVCAGYADAFAVLLQRIGIESYYVSSEEMDHGWNLVYVDGDWYHVDVTWSDPVGLSYDEVNEGYTAHTYFMRSDDEYINDLGHYGFSDSFPDADNSGSYEGYIFRNVNSRMNYYDSYWYYLEKGSSFGTANNTYITRSKIDGSDKTQIPITGYADYMHLYGSKLYYNVGDEEYGAGTQCKVYSYDIDTGEEKLELDIRDTYPGYFIEEFGLKSGKLILVLSNEEGTRCIRLAVDPEKLGSSAIPADEITFYNRYAMGSIVVSDYVNDAYTFESDDTSIATVDADGNVTVVDVGETTIKVMDTAGNVMTDCKVILDDSFFVTDLEIVDVPGEMSIEFPVTFGLTTTRIHRKFYNVVWSSSDKSIATVDSNGVVTATAFGTVTITARDIDSGYSASYTISVEEAVRVTGIELDKNSLLINKYGQVEQLNYTIYPENATCKDIEWSVDKLGVLRGEGQDGTIQAWNDGIATVTVTTKDGEYTAACEVTVKVTEYNGVDYSAVFDYGLYSLYHEWEIWLMKLHYVDDVIKYFVESGMALGHQGNDTFELEIYKNSNPDLVSLYGDDNKAYYIHYITEGKDEDRTATSMFVIDEARFPDEAFRNYVKENIDTIEGSEGILTRYEREWLDEIDVSYNENVKSLKGVEYFTNISTLYCQYTGITELDISKNTKLKNVDCRDTGVRELDISNNKELYSVSMSIGEVYGCKSYDLGDIKGFDTSKVSEWKYAVCEDGTIKITDISQGHVECTYERAGEDDVSYRFYFNYMGDHNYINGTCTLCGEVFAGIEINETNFPDEVFRNYVSTNFDSESGTEGMLSRYELDNVQGIYLMRKRISSLKGIEYFDKAVQIYIYGTGITSFDISAFPKLSSLGMDIGEVCGCESYDLSDIKGFDFSKASEWQNAVYEDGKIKITEPLADYVYCRYKYAEDDGSSSSDYNSYGYYQFYFDYAGDHLYENGTCTKCGAAMTGIEINEITFPDEAFREYVLTKIDTESGTEGILTGYEIKSAENIDVSHTNVEDLTGIEYFTDMISLRCSYTDVTSLDISHNAKLRMLYCHNTGLTSLDVSGNEVLYGLYCYDTDITDIDISKNKELQYLEMSIGDVTGCKPCDFSRLAGFDVCTAFDWRYAVCENGNVTITDRDAGYIGCYYPLESEFPGEAKFYFYYIGDHIYSAGVCTACGAAAEGVKIDETNFPDEVFRNYVSTNFDIGSETSGVLTADEIDAATIIIVNNMDISSLKGIEYFTNLCYLECSGTKLTCLDVSSNAKLITLQSYNNVYDLGYIDKVVDLSVIPGFDTSKATEWSGATYENGKLVDITGSLMVSYTYDCGNGFVMYGTIKGTVSYPTIHDGIDYSAVYDYEYYVDKYPEIIQLAEEDSGAAVLKYFVENGMALGHQASDEFSFLAYKSNYPDLGVAFGSDNTKYYMHYINNGRAEGRNATVILVESDTKYYGVEYAEVYNYDYYINNNPDLKAAFGDNKAAALIHFANMGMKEGRQACENFGPKIYKFNYPELQKSFGEDMVLYYHHYMDYGKDEGRNGATRDFSAYCEYEGVNYTPVYNYEDYIERNPDVFDAYGLDANAVLKHFVTIGMAEGRQGSDDFNYDIYRSNYPDLEVAFGEDRAQYYHHYINSGYNEGRNAATSDYTSDTVYAGVDYADVYSYDYYVTANPDVVAAIGDNRIAILAHFVRNGMAEGRQGSAEFNVYVYMEKNPDLVEVYGTELKEYYVHYINEGKAAGRVAE